MVPVPGESYTDRNITADLSMDRGMDPGAAIMDDDPRIKAAEDVVERFRVYLDTLQDSFDRAVKWWKWYLTQRKENFKPWEYWRGRVALPWFFEGIETNVAHVQNHFWGTSPPVKPEITLGASPMLEKKMEGWFKYVFRKNRFKAATELAFRETFVQGACFRKNTLIERTRETMIFPSMEQAELFDKQLEGVVMNMGVQPPSPTRYPDRESFQKDFESFRQAVNAAGASLPEMPVAGPRKVTHYKGPGWKDISYWSYLYDVSKKHHDQEMTMIHSIVPKSWVEERTGPSEDFAFDPDAVAYALRQGNKATGAYSSSGVNIWEQKLRDSIGQTEPGMPVIKDPVELIECFKPLSKIPYRVVLNGCICINKRKTIPFEHADIPITPLINHQLPFSSSGISDMAAGESIMKEANKLRGLRLDGVSMSVLPIFARMRDSGLADIAKFIVPGSILDTIRARGSLTQASQVELDMSSFRELSEMRTEVDGSMNSYPQSRGALGPTSVTATQTERAFQGMNLKVALKIDRVEGDFANLPSQWLSIAHQFYGPDEISKLTKDLLAGAMEPYTVEDFMQAIEMDWEFAGSRTQANKELEIQNLKDLYTLALNGASILIDADKLLSKAIEKVDPVIHAAVQRDPNEVLLMKQQQIQATTPTGGGKGGA